jgi:hypothetical protein
MDRTKALAFVTGFAVMLALAAIAHALTTDEIIRQIFDSATNSIRIVGV